MTAEEKECVECDDFTEEDNKILDKIWDRIGKERLEKLKNQAKK
jgi:predicted SnoaL-like aldol condensation-catalyzing enzyme